MEPGLSSTRFFSLTEGSLTNNEVTYYESVIVDRLNSAPVRRSAPLGLSLLWLCTLGLPRGTGRCLPRAAPHRPILTSVRTIVSQRQRDNESSRYTPAMGVGANLPMHEGA